MLAQTKPQEPVPTQEKPENMSKKRNKIVVVLLALLLLLLRICTVCMAIYIVYLVLPYISHAQPPTTQAQTQTPLAVVDNDAVEDGSISPVPTQSTDQKVQPVRLIISAAPSFDTAKAKGSLQIANHKDNKGLTLQVQLLDADGKQIYISPMLEPGQKIERDYLIAKNLKAGEYPVQAVFDYYHKADQSYYYRVPVKITLCIQN